MGTLRIKWPSRGVQTSVSRSIPTRQISRKFKVKIKRPQTAVLNKIVIFHRLVGLRKRRCTNAASSTNIWHLLSAPYVASVLCERASILPTRIQYLLSCAVPSINIHRFYNVMFSIQKPLEFAKYKLIKARKGTPCLAYSVHFTSSCIQMQTSGVGHIRHFTVPANQERL